MLDDTDLPWPRCLGTFDEESARYFLHEVGARTVPKYPFSCGIDEVYGSIFEQYGFHGVSDVTSLLQELLEDDHNAGGLGDDGDVWRSWRHSWRHRNDDVLNPFIPRFGPLILPHPTSPRIRCLKALNFLRETSADAVENPTPDDMYQKEIEDILGPLFLEPLYMRGGDNASGLPQTDVLNMQDHHPACRRRLRSLTETAQTTTAKRTRAASTPDMAKSWSFLDKVSECLGDRLSLSGDSERETEQLQQDGRGFREKVLGPTKAYDPVAIPSTPGSKELAKHAVTSNACTSAPFRECLTSEVSACTPNLPRVHPIDHKTSQGPLIRVVGEAKGSLHVCNGGASSDRDNRQNRRIPDDGRRAMNRQARMIGGTIFTLRTKRSRSAEYNQRCEPVVPERHQKTSSRRPSSTPTKPRNSLRSNVTRELRRILHREEENKQLCRDHKHSSTFSPQVSHAIDCPSNMLASGMSQALISPKSASIASRGQLFLDGASDQPETSHLSITLNKPLPLSPDDIVRRMSTRSQLTSSQYSDATLSLPSTSSTTYSTSGTSSKKEFQDMTRDLLHFEKTGAHELPPIRETVVDRNGLSDPKKLPSQSYRPETYTSVAGSNPFLEKKSFRSPPKPPPLDFSKLHRGNDKSSNIDLDSNFVTPHLTTSQDAKHSDTYFPSVPLLKPTSRPSQDVNDQENQGRRKPKAIAPVASKQEDLPPKTPTKRSRSPIRRFLGLSKSTSTTKIEQPETPSRPKTPVAATKESLKKWGDRFRYGFLTPDQEQLRQEELIEAHNNNSATSTPQNSTFPVSLEPPIQAKIQSEIELIMTVTANRYLLRESRAGRISAESVAKTKELWEKMNRPQVIEFHYDQLTQHHLVMTNLDRVKLYGDAAKDAIAINSTMRGWKILAREMSVRTFCSPDSVIRKHLHDAHRVLELLGAPLVTFLAYEDMQLKALAKISQRQKERMERRAGSIDRNFSSSSVMMAIGHRRNISEGSYRQLDNDYSDYPITALQMDKISLSPSPTPFSHNKVRKATGGEGAIMSLPVDLEKMRNEYISKMRGAKMGIQTVKEI